MTQIPGAPPDLVASLPASSRRLLYVAGFFGFASVGFVADLMDDQVAPVAAVVALAAATGLTSVLVIYLAAFYPRWTLLALALPVVVAAALNDPGGVELADASPDMIRTKTLVDGIGCLVGFVVSYSAFMRFIGAEGSRYARIHAEVELARGIHRLLVPNVDAVRGRYEFYGLSRASSEVGGDLVDLLPLPSGWLGYVADVSGHGVASGLLMGIVKSAVRTRMLAGGSLDAVLTDVNRVLVPLTRPNMFATLAALHDDGEGVLTVTTAGHPPVLHYQAAARRLELLALPQIPLGLFDDRVYASVLVRPAPGDLFVIITDGLSEVFDKSDREFGFARLADVIQAGGDRPLRQIADNVLRQVDRHGPQSDDQTMLLVRVREGPAALAS